MLILFKKIEKNKRLISINKVGEMKIFQASKTSDNKLNLNEIFFCPYCNEGLAFL